jgi:hypothetical protein
LKPFRTSRVWLAEEAAHGNILPAAEEERAMRTWYALSRLVAPGVVLATNLAAEPAVARDIGLQWAGTQKIEQIIGDVDWATGAPTRSQTFTKSYVLANGLGYSFERFNRTLWRNELIFLFGDTAAFGTYSFVRGFDCNAVPVGAAISAETHCTTPPTPPSHFVCPLGPPPVSTNGSCGKSAFNFQAQDPIARSGTTDPETPLDLEFFMNGQLPLFVTPTPLKTASGIVPIATGGDDIPNSGIGIEDKIYIVYSTGSDPSCAKPCDPYAKGFSVLVRFDEDTRTFETLRQLSAVDAGGHFLYTTMHQAGAGVAGVNGEPSVLMFGTGDYRNSEVYLARIPTDKFSTGMGTRYFTGLVNGRPTWTQPATTAQQVLDNQRHAVPVFFDRAPSPSIGNISVAYVPAIGLWLMTYNADGTNPPATRSVFLRYAAAPWGPWSDPQPIFNACNDGGFGSYIHYHRDLPGSDCAIADPPPSGPGGPMIDEDTGNNDPETSRGGAFAPSIIERFTTLKNGKFSIYYTLSTWNPYTVIKMRSDFNMLFTDRDGRAFRPDRPH